MSDLVFSSMLTAGSLSAGTFFLLLGMALALGAVIALVYTVRSDYTKSFVVTLALLPAPSWAGPQSAETEGLQASPPLPALVLITLSSSAWSPLGGTYHSDTCPQPWGPTPVLLLQPLGGPVLPSGWARGVDTGREAGGVPRGSLHPHPLSTVLPVTLPLQSRGWGPLSPHGADLACGVVSPRRPSAAWGAVRPSTSMHTPVLRPARGSVGVRHPCFQRSPLCNYVAPAVYTVK